MIINSSFFMRLKWKRSLWQTSVWSCQFYVMMCLEWNLRSFFLPSFICCIFVCISLHAYIEDNVHFKCGGKGLEKEKKIVFCFLCLLFSVSVLVFVYCIYLLFSYLFPIVAYFQCLFLFLIASHFEISRSNKWKVLIQIDLFKLISDISMKFLKHFYIIKFK